MGTIMKYLLLFALIFVNTAAKAQTNAELLKKIQNTKNKDSAILLYDELARKCVKATEFEKAIEYQKKALELCKLTKVPFNIAYGYNNLANIYLQRGNLNEAITNYTEALKELEKNNLERDAALCYGNIGNIFIKLKQYDKALEYIQKALEIKTRLGEKNIINNLFAISNVYKVQEKYSDAITYLNKAFALLDTTKPEQRRLHIIIMNSLGSCYRALAEYDKALGYYQRSEALTEKNDKDRLHPLYSNMAALYEAQKQYRTSLYYELRSYEYAKKLDNPEELLNSYQNLVVMYAHLNMGDSANYFFTKYKEATDTVNQMQNAKYVMEIGTKYETEKKENQIKLLAKDKELQDLKIMEQLNEINSKEIEARQKENEIKLLNQDKDLKAIVLQQEIVNKQKKEKENELLNTQNKLSLQTIQQQRTITYFIIAGLLLVSGMAFFVFRGLKMQRKANYIISLQKTEVEHQKHLVEEKQKEIIDSINYAKRIQTTLLAHEDFLKAHIPGNFVLFKPKDIVSGDFYWATENQGKFYLAVCDSTGHGVPGAFMSLMNIGFLNEAINEKNILEPNKVLDHARQRLVSTISKEGQQDGFDGILLCLDKTTRTITYSAAHNAPVIVKGNELKQLESDKMPVGKGESATAFRLFTIELKPDETLYLYTDGFADQFGGPKGKKFLYKKLNQVLTDNASLSMMQQKENLERTFDKWKGELEQVDDVLLIGLKLN
jgi:serine phosphatase RsbU (regulator of sigma subunit)